MLTQYPLQAQQARLCFRAKKLAPHQSQVIGRGKKDCFKKKTAIYRIHFFKELHLRSSSLKKINNRLQSFTWSQSI